MNCLAICEFIDVKIDRSIGQFIFIPLPLVEMSEIDRKIGTVRRGNKSTDDVRK